MHSCPLLVPDSHPSVSSTTSRAMLFNSSFFSCFSSLMSVIFRSLGHFVFLSLSSTTNRAILFNSSCLFALFPLLLFVFLLLVSRRAIIFDASSLCVSFPFLLFVSDSATKQTILFYSYLIYNSCNNLFEYSLRI